MILWSFCVDSCVFCWALRNSNWVILINLFFWGSGGIFFIGMGVEHKEVSFDVVLSIYLFISVGEEKESKTQSTVQIWQKIVLTRWRSWASVFYITVFFFFFCACFCVFLLASYFFGITTFNKNLMQMGEVFGLKFCCHLPNSWGHYLGLWPKLLVQWSCCLFHFPSFSISFFYFYFLFFGLCLKVLECPVWRAVDFNEIPNFMLIACRVWMALGCYRLWLMKGALIVLFITMVVMNILAFFLK